MKSASPPPREAARLPLADLDGAELYSSGWSGGGRVFSIWWQLPSGALALATFTPGELGQDTQARIMLE